VALSLEPFRATLRPPGAARLLVASLLGRMPSGMGPLALVLLVQGLRGSYADAGLVAGAFAVAQAVGGPAQSRLIDRTGQTLVLGVCGTGFAAAFAAMAVAADRQAGTGWLVGLAVAAGLLFPPFASALRALWPSMLTPDQLPGAYALESTVQELVFIAGPLLVAALVATTSPAVAVVAAAGCTLAGTAVFVTADRSRRWRGSSAAADWAGPLRSPTVVTVVAAQPLIAIAFAHLQVAVAAHAERLGVPPAAGVLLAVWTLGSLTGGLLNGALAWKATPRRRLLTLAAALAAAFAPLALTPSLVPFGLLLAIAGLPIAPYLAAGYTLVGQAAPQGTTTEAFTWVTTGFLAGLAAGSALAGAVVQTAGPVAAFLTASAALAAAAVLMAARARTLDLPDSAR